MFVLVCLCRFLWQTVMLTYRCYELVTHFDLSLDLFLGDFWISSHYSLTVYHRKIWIWINSVNTVLINSTACCWSACKQGVVFLFLHWCQTLWWACCFMLTQHRAVDLLSYQFIPEIINTSKLTIFGAIFRWDSWKRLSTAIQNPMWVME